MAIADLGARIEVAVHAKEQCRETVMACRSSWADATGHLVAGAVERGDVLERLRAAHDAMSQRDRLLDLERDAEERVAESDDDGRRVESLGRELGLEPSGATVSRLRAAVAALQARFLERRDCERDLANNDEALSVLEAREAASDKEVIALKAEGSEVLPRLAIRPQATSAEAGAALAAWRDAHALLPSMAQSERRVSRIKEDCDEFVSQAEALLCDVAPDAPHQDPFVAIRQLRSRLDRERNLQARAEGARANLEARVAAATLAGDTLAVRVASEAALRMSLGIDAGTDLEPLLDALSEAAVVDANLRRARLRLDETLAGRPEHVVRAEVGDSDPVAIVGRRSIAEADAAEAFGEVARAIERHVACGAALAEVEARGGAASAAQDEQDANAAAAAEGFVRSHAAARLLSHAIERYRERHQLPVVTRASDHFSLLTEGRWSGLAVDYGEESPILKPVRDADDQKKIPIHRCPPKPLCQRLHGKLAPTMWRMSSKGELW